MSTSRLEVPLTLSPPHFDDDATIATARQVVPIKGSRRTGTRRKLLTLLPLLIASTLCGALGAIAVNYFERDENTTASVKQQQLPNVSTQATEPAAVSPESELNAKNPDTQASAQPEDTAVIPPADEPATQSDKAKTAERKAEVKHEEPEQKSAPAPVKREPEQDAAKLVRKRRVQPEESEIPVRRNRRNAASRIEDLFTGPNP